eukprot:2359476-Rhodomonas_salina.2
MMVPEAVPVALLQQQYLSDRSSMEVKDGPSGTADDLASIEVEKEDFTKASVLVAPPIIFQTRAMPRCAVPQASECSNSFAQQFIKDQHAYPPPAPSILLLRAGLERGEEGVEGGSGGRDGAEGTGCLSQRLRY